MKIYHFDMKYLIKLYFLLFLFIIFFYKKYLINIKTKNT